MALGSNQLLNKMSTRITCWGKCGWCVGLTTLPPFYADYLEIWKPQLLNWIHRHTKYKVIFNLSEILIEIAGFESIYSKRVQCQSFENDGNRRSSMMLLLQPVDLRAYIYVTRLRVLYVSDSLQVYLKR